jgi:23S rRNA pseudouridine1911/1915/1917 synthase
VPEVTVLAVTDDLVYVDKPAGVHTHRLRPDDPLALADAVALVHPECMDASDDPREGGAVHRLDHETSGVVVFARNATAWAAAHRAIRTGAADKLYLALCEGEPARLDALEPDPHPTPTLPAGLRVASPVGHRIDAPIGRGAGPGVCRVRPDGQPAKTLVWMLEPVPTGVDPPRQLCLLKLVTGRRHQARVHLAHVGLPIVGDTRYGAAGARRLGLHALRLDLSAVVQGQTPVDAPLPVELLGPLDPA